MRIGGYERDKAHDKAARQAEYAALLQADQQAKQDRPDSVPGVNSGMSEVGAYQQNNADHKVEKQQLYAQQLKQDEGRAAAEACGEPRRPGRGLRRGGYQEGRGTRGLNRRSTPLS